ncbi:hypothetical protein L1987_53525 [Smallanthus sonchifolius]|uniref:Uncharacterized protein n=1 Tax=Smallanthus sonchifolius TaxID=185202 RepID=A0ACB9EWI4_9ASTR|nr:hypothetical protein L1987_53525 [Smallanthus sonchifolius]
MYKKISGHFQSHCIIDNIREESSKHGLETLQEQILSRLLNTKVKVQSIEEGKNMIRSRLSNSSVLILLDDIDDRKQLDALAGSHNWWGNIDKATEVFEACGYHPDIGIEVLKQKALITIVDGKFDMHDLIQEMGHNIVRGEHPNNPEKHSRVWKDEEIKNMFHGDASMENYKIEAIQYDGDPSLFCKIVSNMKRVSLQKKLWNGCKHLPHLKVLELFKMENLLYTPDFGGLPCLRKLTLKQCKRLMWIHPSLGNHACLEDVCVSFCDRVDKLPTIVHMGKLKTLEIYQCDDSLEFPEIKSNMESLVKLTLNNMWIDVVLSSIGEGRFPNLISLHLSFCSLKNKGANYCVLEHLEEFKLIGIDYLGKPNHLHSLLIDIVMRRRERYRKYRSADSMLRGMDIENHSMLLRLEGLEIAKRFTPLVRGGRYTLNLPENWRTDFCGFLMCVVMEDYGTESFTFHSISMKPMISGMDSEDDVVWEESEGGKYTWVFYVSFATLSHTPWWNSNYKAISIHNIHRPLDLLSSSKTISRGFGVALVARESGSGPTKTTSTKQEESEISHYTPKFEISHDSAALQISFPNDRFDAIDFH